MGSSLKNLHAKYQNTEYVHLSPKSRALAVYARINYVRGSTATHSPALAREPCSTSSQTCETKLAPARSSVKGLGYNTFIRTYLHTQRKTLKRRYRLREKGVRIQFRTQPYAYDNVLINHLM